MDKKTRFNLYAFAAASHAHMQIAAQDVLYANTDRFIGDYLKSEVDKKMAEFNQQDLSQVPEDEISAFTSELSDYYGLSHIAKDELSRYMIVATFSAYERGIKKVLALTGALNAQELRSCYKKENLVNLLTQKFGLQFSTLKDSNLIEELRCLNNDVKHNAIVGNQLVSANAKWHAGEVIGNTHADFERLCNAPYNLLTDLAKKIEATL